MRKSFHIPTIRKRTKKIMRRKFKKTVRLSVISLIWKDYVEHGIIRPLLKYGKIVVDQHLTLEIVGRKVVNDPKLYNLASKGLKISKNGVVPITKVNPNRPGISYKIQLTDNTYKGKIIFEADKNLSKRVSEHLFNTLQPYRMIA